MLLFATVLAVTIRSGNAAGETQGRCNFPLGMEDGRIRDKDITASDFHVDSSAAHFARFNSHKGAGAWCHPSIAKDNENEYLQIRLNGAALVSLIALQGRFYGRESVQRVRVNVSMDGERWEEAEEVLGPTGEETAHRPITPTRANFVRLVPLTDRLMPVCLRTEIFGCYVNTTGQELSNGKRDDWLRMDDKGIEFTWDGPVHFETIQVVTLKRDTTGLSEIQVKLANTILVYELPSNKDSGIETLILHFNRTIEKVTLSFKFTGTLMISEVEWLKENRNGLEPLVYDITEVNHETYLSAFIVIIAIISILGCVIVALVSCICLRKKHQDKELGQCSTMLTEGTWINIIPKSSEFVYNRQDSVISMKRYPSTACHEYSEIGSMMADSGRGDSITRNDFAK